MSQINGFSIVQTSKVDIMVKPAGVFFVVNLFYSNAFLYFHALFSIRYAYEPFTFNHLFLPRGILF